MTAPLTPPDCDLTDFPFMPLEVARLRRSKAWLICKRTPALAFYMLNLWTACWHERPAGSLEDDDDVLADQAMCDPAKWDKVKADVLRGWVLCDDGRYYHPTVCEKVVEAWNAKLDQRWRTECSRIKKHNDRHGTNVPRPTFEEWLSADCPQGQRLPVTRDNDGTGGGQVGETRSKGQGEGQGEREGQGQGQGESMLGGAARTDAAADASAQPRTTRAPRGERLPKGWTLPREWGVWAIETYPLWTPEKVRLEAERFADHWRAKTGKDATKLDWLATWRNWCRSPIAHRDDPKPAGAPPARGRGSPSDADLAAANAAADAEAARRLFGAGETIDA